MTVTSLSWRDRSKGRAMLAMSKYPQEYVDACRRQVGAQVEAYRAMAAAASGTAAETALAEFEPTFFNNLVLALEMHFVHRTRTMEKKDGNPLNEVRVLAMSLISNDGLMGEDKTIKLSPERSVLGYAVGEVIAVREEGFVALAKAYFADLEAKFV